MNIKHGLSKTPQYRVWIAMIQRCRNPKQQHYADYGGRGITVDSRWNQYESFLEDMGIRPEGGTIERMDNNGNYTKSNCRWATKKEQQGNKRDSDVYEFDGVKKCLSHWAEVYQINSETVRDRLRRGWTIERALTVPVRPATGKHSTIRLERNGITKTLCVWAKELGIDESTIRKRYRKGYSGERLFSRPKTRQWQEQHVLP